MIQKILTRWVIMAALLTAATLVTLYFHRVLGSATVFTHLFYIPIILSALWWGRAGSMVAMGLVAMLITSHRLHITTAAELDDYFRSIMFLVVSWTVIMLRGRILSAESSLKKQAHELENRVRALSCLYGLNKLRDKPMPVEKVLAETEKMLQTALAGESAVKVNIHRDGRQDGITGSMTCPVKMVVPIMVDGQSMGSIEIGWPEDGDPEAEVVDNVKELTDSIAKRLSKIFEHEKARSELDRYRLHLEDLVQDRTEELIDVNRRLRDEIDERQKAEISLRESEKQYRTLFENASEAIFIAQDNRIRFPNPALAALGEYDIDQLLKMSFSDLIHPEDRDMVMERYTRRIAGKAVPNAYAFRIQTADGQPRWVEINTVLIQWHDQPGTLNFLRDITTRKKMEAAISQVEKMEAIGVLAGGIAHKFNNALSSITGNIDLLRYTAPDNADVQRYSDAMIEAVQNMNGLTQQLLAYARGGKYQSQRYTLSLVVKDVLLQMAPMKEKRIKFETVFSPDTPEVEADPVQMRMVMLAIIQNAAEAIDKEGHIRIETFRADMDETATGAFEGLPPGEYASLNIADNGKGMEAEVRKRMFEPFFSTKFFGRGLGMAAAYGIIKNHGGFIYVDSEPDRGTVVHIFLPRSA